MKTSELTGAALDWAVAKCEGRDTRPGRWRGRMFSHGGIWQPSTNWAQGGPIIERERIRIWAMNFRSMWEADFPSCDGPKDDIRMPGPTPLIAAMRCYVASKLGDNIDIPEELT